MARLIVTEGRCKSFPFYFKKMEDYMKPFKYFDMLTDREKDVIRVMHLGMKDTLGLSPDYFQEVLADARTKLGIDPDVKRR